MIIYESSFALHYLVISHRCRVGSDGHEGVEVNVDEGLEDAVDEDCVFQN